MFPHSPSDDSWQRALMLDETKLRLEFVLEAAAVGTWSLNLIDDSSKCSLQHDRIFGYHNGMPFKDWGYRRFIEHTHPEDRVLVQQRLEEAQLTDSFSVECRIIWPDQSVHWMAAWGKVFRDRVNNPIIMVGVNLDITAHKLTELSLQNKIKESAKWGEAMINHEQKIAQLEEELEALRAELGCS